MTIYLTHDLFSPATKKLMEKNQSLKLQYTQRYGFDSKNTLYIFYHIKQKKEFQ